MRWVRLALPISAAVAHRMHILALILLFIIGIMYAAGSFDTYGNFFKGLTDTIIQKGAGDAGEIIGGGGGR